MAGIEFNTGLSAGGTRLIEVVVRSPERARLRPCDVVCVIDTSGSMQLPAMVKTAEGESSDGDGLDRLDLVKHAVHVITNTLSPADRLAVVSYNDVVAVDLGLTQMNPAGVAAADAAVGSLRADRATNMWGGLLAGMQLLEGVASPDRTAVVMLMTDGQPNVEPAGGHRASLEQYLHIQPSASFRVDTFGFGFDLDSRLLHEIGEVTGGTYTYIPDSSFVGTAFVNSIANIRTTLRNGVELIVKPRGGAIIDKVYGYGEVDAACSLQVGAAAAAATRPGERTVRLGPVLSGQDRSIVLAVTAPAGYSDTAELLTVTMPMLNAPGERSATVSSCAVATAGANPLDPEIHRVRCEAVELITRAVAAAEAGTVSPANIGAFVDTVKGIPASEDSRVAALLEDLEGQVTEALSDEESFTRWGGHYLRSLGRSHLLQICTNFKDPGLQVYGGSSFEKIRDEGDDAFLSLPPPVHAVDPVLAALMAQYAEPMAQAAQAPSQRNQSLMRMYHNQSNPCFHGAGMVAMADGSAKRVDEICKGNTVDGGAAVVCAVRTRCENGVADLVVIDGGLKITPWHPIRTGSCTAANLTGAGKSTCIASVTASPYCYPINHPAGTLTTDTPCNAIYSFVLSHGHEMVIDGFGCVTLGHGIEGDPVASHPFWGTNEVVRAIMQLEGSDTGLVELETACVVRDASGTAVGLKQLTRSPAA